MRDRNGTKSGNRGTVPVHLKISTLRLHPPSCLPSHGAVAVTSVVVYCAQVFPVKSTVNCAAPSCPLAHTVPAVSSPPANVTGVIPAAPAGSALKSVPLKPTMASTPTRSGRKLASKERWTRRTEAPFRVEGVSWRSAEVSTQAASTISPGFC